MKKLLFIPGPVMVSPAVLRAMGQPLIDHRSPEFSALQERVVAGLRPIFGTREAEIILLGSSGTGGLEAAITNTFSRGETLLSAPMGAFGQRMVAIARKYGINVETIETAAGSAVDPKALAERLAADSGHSYAGILLTHNETSTGVQSDMAELAAVVRGHPAMAIVDSVSGLGSSAFLMDTWGYDIVVSAPQKVLAAPPGAAFVAVSPRAWKKIEAATAPRFYFDLLKAREFARHGQTPWTPPVSVLFALDVALAQYHREGVETTGRRLESYARAIRAAFGALGLQVFSQEGAHSTTVVTAAVPPAIDAAKLLRDLREKRGVTLAGGQLELKGKIIRMGTMGEITQTDILAAIEAIEIALLDYEFPVHIGEAGKAALSVFLESPLSVTPGVAQKNDAQMGVQTMETSG